MVMSMDASTASGDNTQQQTTTFGGGGGSARSPAMEDPSSAAAANRPTQASADEELTNEDEESKASGQTVVASSKRQQAAAVFSPSQQQEQLRMSVDEDDDDDEEDEGDDRITLEKLAATRPKTQPAAIDDIGQDLLVARMRDIVEGGQLNIQQQQQQSQQQAPAGDNGSGESLDNPTETNSKASVDSAAAQKRTRHSKTHHQCARHGGHHHHHHHNHNLHHHHHHHQNQHKQSVGAIGAAANSAPGAKPTSGQQSSHNRHHHHHHHHHGHNHDHGHHHHHHSHAHQHQLSGTESRRSSQQMSSSKHDVVSDSQTTATVGAGTEMKSSTSSVSSSVQQQQQLTGDEPAKAQTEPAKERCEHHPHHHHHHHHHAHGRHQHHRSHKKRLVLDTDQDPQSAEGQQATAGGSNQNFNESSMTDSRLELGANGGSSSKEGSREPLKDVTGGHSNCCPYHSGRHHHHHHATNQANATGTAAGDPTDMQQGEHSHHQHAHYHHRHHGHHHHHHHHNPQQQQQQQQPHSHDHGHHSHHHHNHSHHHHHAAKQRHRTKHKSSSNTNIDNDQAGADKGATIINQQGNSSKDEKGSDKAQRTATTTAESSSKLQPTAAPESESKMLLDQEPAANEQAAAATQEGPSASNNNNDEVVRMDMSPANEPKSAAAAADIASQQKVQTIPELGSGKENTQPEILVANDSDLNIQGVSGSGGADANNKGTSSTTPAHEFTRSHEGDSAKETKHNNKLVRQASTPRDSNNSSTTNGKDGLGKSDRQQQQSSDSTPEQHESHAKSQLARSSQPKQIVESTILPDRSSKLSWCCCCPCSRSNSVIKSDTKTLGVGVSNSNANMCPTLPNVPLEEIRMWGDSFDRLMKCPDGRKVFQDFLRCEYSEENILFWIACEELKSEKDDKSIANKARDIYEDYISILSAKEVSLDSRVRDIINNNIKKPTSNIFDEAQLQIYTLMHRDSYPRFINSPMYKKLAQLQTTSRKGSS